MPFSRFGGLGLNTNPYPPAMSFKRPWDMQQSYLISINQHGSSRLSTAQTVIPRPTTDIGKGSVICGARAKRFLFLNGCLPGLVES